MYAMIRLGNGKFYTSYVYGYFCPVTAEEDYQRYLERVHNRYYLVLNEEKNCIVKQFVFNRQNSPYLDQSIIIVDDNIDDWEIDEGGQGCISLLKKYDPSAIEQSICQEDLLRCLELDKNFIYEPIQTVSNQMDISRLLTASGEFHDACIEKYHSDDDSLYVLFESVWGYRIEVWFDGDVSWSMDSRDPEKCDPYWLIANVFIKDNWIYLVDEGIDDPNEINENYCWFKARRMRYHIIPK